MSKSKLVLKSFIFSTLMLSACVPSAYPSLPASVDPNIGANQVTAELKAKLRAIRGVIDLIEPPKAGCLVSLLIDPKTPNEPVQAEANNIAPKNVPVCVNYSR